MEIISTYWSFVSRPPPAHDMGIGFNAVENFYWKLLVWTLLFCVVHWTSVLMPKYFAPKWFNALPDRKRAEWPSYVMSSLHHLIMVPIGWVHIYEDFMRDDAVLSIIDYSITEGWIAPICVGYLLGDTICYAFPELLSGRWEYFLHHVLTAWLVTYVFLVPGHLLRYIPHFVVCETPNILFNLCWFLRLTQLKDSTAILVCELVFAILFFLLRNINLSLVISTCWTHGYSQQLGWVSYMVVIIGLLQWYWLYKIVASVVKRRISSKKSE